MLVCLDTSAWLEYFNAGPHGPTVRNLLTPGSAITPAVVAAEIVEAARHRGASSRVFLHFLQARSLVAPVDAEVARVAGKLNAERSPKDPSWTLVESLVLATSRHHHARLVTRDPIFQDEPNAIWLGWGSTTKSGKGAKDEKGT